MGFLVRREIIKILKIKTLIGGLFVTGAVVGGGSAALGASARKNQQEKQIENFTGHIQNEINKTYKKTLDSLTLKANYEKIYLQSYNSIKKAIPQTDNSIKILTKTPL